MRKRIISRLKSYWRLEAANAVFVPGLVAILVINSGDRVSTPLMLAMAACALLLVIGATAWRMELRSAEGDTRLECVAMPWLARLQTPSLSLAALSVCAAGVEVWRDGGWSPSALATTILALLAALEYINYYVIQLQHFDHAADFARLIRGKGFREAHLAKSLRRWRENRTRNESATAYNNE
jgi:hypothetical protein